MQAATPLIGLDAVVLDTETTGLDTRTARIVQIGAVRLVKGAVSDEDNLVTLVNPEQPIPAAATAVHGISDDDVRTAPRFVDAYREFRQFAGETLVIGHSIAFDMAVFSRECAQADIPFAPPLTLDTEMLAEIANPDLPGTAIESLAAWLDIDVVERHTAFGDAVTTAHIFTRLIPHLRARGVRTRGEALAACRALADARAAAGQASLRADDGVAAPAQSLARIDPYPFRHRNRELMSAPPELIGPDRPIGEAIQAMVEAKVSSLFTAAPETDAPTGIVTERDVIRAIAAGGGAALTQPVGDIASSPLVTVEADDHIYRAIGQMTSRRIRHLAVTNREGTVIGALSARDLLRLRSSEAITLGEEIDSAEDVGTLAAAWARLPAVAAALLEEEVAAIDVAAIISREIAALTRKAAMMGEARLAEAGDGSAPAAYAVLVLGSVGRGESLLAADQDNAIVYADGGDAAETDAWFAKLGRHIADILHECGIPYCKGGVMATNAEWRRSLGCWKTTIAEWVTRSNPQDLLLVDIFFDLMAAHGDRELADALWAHAYDMGRRGADFAKLLAETSADFQPPISFFGGLQTENGRVDLKKGGLLPIVSAARVLSIRHHLPAHSTPERLRAVSRLDIGGGDDLARLIEIHRLVVDHILRQQVEDIAAGIPPSNKVDIGRLGRSRRNELRDALKSVNDVAPLVRDLIFAEPAETGRSDG